MNFMGTIEQNKQSVELKLTVSRKKALREMYIEPLNKDKIFNSLIITYKNKNYDYVSNAYELIDEGFIYKFDDLAIIFPELKEKYESFESGLKKGNLAILACLILKIRDDETFRKDFLLDNSGKIKECIYKNGYKEQLDEAITSSKIKKKK